jgi:hypothetical protein
MKHKFSSVLKLLSVPLFCGYAVSAQAGGLFGEGGLIRGDVGRILDPVEQQIFTPAARGAVVAGSGFVGGVGGTILGCPACGVYVGEQFGEAINERFAGRGNPIGRSANSGPSYQAPYQPPQNYGYNQPRYNTYYSGYNRYYPRQNYYAAPRQHYYAPRYAPYPY